MAALARTPIRLPCLRLCLALPDGRGAAARCTGAVLSSSPGGAAMKPADLARMMDVASAVEALVSTEIQRKVALRYLTYLDRNPVPSCYPGRAGLALEHEVEVMSASADLRALTNETRRLASLILIRR